jgi:hypothetical protein
VRTAPPLPAARGGGQVQLLVLAAGTAGCAAVDVATGTLVRAHYSGPAPEPLAPYDLVVAQLGDDDHLAFAPESVVIADTPARVGRLTGRRAERYLRPLLHPPTAHLLGSVGPTVPFWTLRADRPSLGLVAPDGIVVDRARTGLRCRFRWRRVTYDLPIHDPRVTRALDHPAATCLSGRALARALGWAPDRLLVALTPPRKGHCYKVVAAVLPRP